MATKIPTYNIVKQSGYFSQLDIMKNGYKNNFSESRSFDDQIEHDTF